MNCVACLHFYFLSFLDTDYTNELEFFLFIFRHGLHGFHRFFLYPALALSAVVIASTPPLSFRPEDANASEAEESAKP
jgi:hypothetical protein